MEEYHETYLSMEMRRFKARPPEPQLTKKQRDRAKIRELFSKIDRWLLNTPSIIHEYQYEQALLSGALETDK